MKIHQLSVRATLSSLGSNPDGLSASEALHRPQGYGPHQIEKIARTPMVVRLLREFVQFFSIILWIAAGLAFVAEWSAPGQGMVQIGIALISCIFVSGLFSFWQEHRVEHTLKALLRLLPQKANLLRAKAVVQVPVEEVVPGDIVLFEQGDFVLAGCRLIEAFNLHVNIATVTGESIPQARDAELASQDNPIRSRLSHAEAGRD